MDCLVWVYIDAQVLQGADIDDDVPLLVLDHLGQFAVAQNKSRWSSFHSIFSLKWSISGIQFENVAVIEFCDQLDVALVFCLIKRRKFNACWVELGSR